MKTAMTYPRRSRMAPPYPNAATRQEVTAKILDFLLISAISIGITASLLFVLAL